MRSERKRINGSRTASIWALVLLLTVQSILTVSGAAGGQTSPPDPSHCAVYHYDPVYSAGNPDPQTPTLYLWNLHDEVTVRAYSEPSGGELLGMARQQAQGLCCVVPLDGDKLMRSGGTLYVTQQTDGWEESKRVALAYKKAANPAIVFEVYQYRGTSSGHIHAGTNGSKIPLPTGLKAGTDYVVTVGLQNFGPVQSLTLPIKYDPAVWQLVGASPEKTEDGSIRYTLNADPVRTGAAGTLLPTFNDSLANTNDNKISAYNFGGRPDYGIGIYSGYMDWGGRQATGGASSQTETPYVNTETGLIKLEFSTSDDMPHTPAASAKFLRLYFKCVQTPTSEQAGANWSNSPLLHFATEADIPAGVTALSEQKRYYCATSPAGVTAAIQGINLLAPPLSVKEGNPCDEDTPLVLTPEEIGSLPQSISQSDQIRQLLENQVKIYNYTNYGDGSSPYGTLDYNQYKIEDILLLTPSATAAGAARQGDQITVYDPEGSVIAGPETVDGEGGVRMLLGTKHLRPEGGQVYLSVTRAGVESAKVAVGYGAEASRDVYFRVYSSGYDGADGRSFDQLEGGHMTVKRGDQIQLRLYFNNFDDLLSYTFALHFNGNVVRAADRCYDPLTPDGYMDEERFRAGDSCFAVGADLADVTLNESIVYELWMRYQSADAAGQAALEQEIDQTMAVLGIETRSRFEQIARDAGVKYSIGADSLPWRGGLLFTGPAREPGTNGPNDPGRGEETLYPYANNGVGLVKISSASLARPPLTLRREDADGYHFLTLYFTAIGSGDPEFRLATELDGGAGYDTATPQGGEIVLAGPGKSATAGGPGGAAENVSAMPFAAHWQAYGMEAEAAIRLEPGNALPTDADPTAVFLYDGCAYRDPGFTVKNPDGTEANCTAVERYYMDGGSKITLPAWQSGEILADQFRVRRTADGALPGSEVYTLVYAYDYETDGGIRTAEITRRVCVIFARGDLDGNGTVDLFDEQKLANHLGGTTALDLEDRLFQSKTADVNGDGSVDEADREVLRRYLLGLGEIGRDYEMPVP